MHTRHSMGCGTLIAALLASAPGFAEVTPQEVWDNWRSYMESYGYEVAAQETISDNTLNVTGLTMSMELPEAAGVVRMTVGDLAFHGQEDGTVMLSLPEILPMNLHMAPTDEEVVDARIEYGQTGFSMVVSGTPDEMTYAYTASELSMSLAELLIDGAPVGTARFDVNLSNLVGNTITKTGNLRNITQNVIIAAMTYDIGVVVPEEEGSFFLKGQLADLQASAESNTPMEMDMQDLSASLKAGFSVDAKLSFGASSSEFSFNDEGNSATGNSSSDGGEFVIAMDDSHLSYGVSSKGAEMSMMGSEIPFPVNVAMAEAAFHMSMPLAKSDMPQDFSLLVKLIGFAPDDMIWGMLDPAGALPHDPANLVVELAGKANWLFDIFDPEQAEAMDGETPGELHALSLKDLQVSIAGTELTGMGDFTFNNDDLETFDGMPAPDGTIELKLVGANGLIDKLIAMGLMSDEDAMGARMMMGLFGRPGDGEDTVLSTIEIKSSGEITANGQRLQ